jgi:glycerol-3-phosphate acyltransferase PlsY
MLELGLKVLLSYLAGALNGALIVGKLAGGIDIRTLGSGNAGGTNALRTQGKWFAFRVMVIDVGKGYLPPWLLPALALPGVPLDPEVSRTWLTLACAGAAVVGHCYPVWFDFKGGKGAATAIGALLAIAPALTLPALVVWCLVLTTTGFVGLATMLAAAVLPVWVGLTQLPGQRELFWFLVALALFIIYTHRGNIQRLREGRESRLEKAMLWRRPR